MKLSMIMSYSGNFKEDVKRVQELESAGLDLVWVPEVYTFDSVSQMGYLAAVTDTIEIGAGIFNVYSRVATAVAQTAAGLDFISDGRFVLGLGASGPQVVEGFFGQPYKSPMPRVRDYINVCRMVWRRDKVEYEGKDFSIPLADGEGTGLGKPLKLINHPLREDIPIFWASLKELSVTNTARHADGWLPIFFDPEKFETVWGDDLNAGLADRDASLGPLQINAGGMLAIGDEYVGDAATQVLDKARPELALYVGGMGARNKNFYNDICAAYGYEAEAKQVQDLYLDGKKDQAASAVPAGMIEGINLVGPAGHIKERLAAYQEAGVTHLQVNPVGGDTVDQIAKLKSLL